MRKGQQSKDATKAMGNVLTLKRDEIVARLSEVQAEHCKLVWGGATADRGGEVAVDPVIRCW